MGRDGGHLLLFVPEAPPMPRRWQSGWQAAGRQRCLLAEQGLICAMSDGDVDLLLPREQKKSM